MTETPRTEARAENVTGDTATALGSAAHTAQSAARSAAQTAAKTVEQGSRRASAAANETAETAARTGQDMMRAGAQVAEAVLSQSRDLIDTSARFNQIALKGLQSVAGVWTDLVTRELSAPRAPAEPGSTETARAVRYLFEASASVAQISSDCLRDAAGLVREASHRSESASRPETGQRPADRTREMAGR